jgi:hypothetical protein
MPAKKSPKAPPNVPPPFNPLDKTNLGRGVADALLVQPVVVLPPPELVGAGIYVIYYEGDFDLYEEIAKANRNGAYLWPIYVGKAVPAGARKGGFGLGANPGLVLYKRLAEHADSINCATNLDLADFKCRFLVVEDIWIPLAESLLIEMFAPVWNRKIEGFGIHDPGGGRRGQRRSAWDELHPGRSWATKQQPPANNTDVIKDGARKYILERKKLVIGED